MEKETRKLRMIVTTTQIFMINIFAPIL
jgi:hypothetical protein